jgi:hypothetical protein
LARSHSIMMRRARADIVRSSDTAARSSASRSEGSRRTPIGCAFAITSIYRKSTTEVNIVVDIYPVCAYIEPMTKDEFRAALFDLLHRANDVPKTDILDVLEAVCEITRDEIPDDDD